MGTKPFRVLRRPLQRVLCCTSIILASYHPVSAQGPGSYTPVSLTFSPSAIANGLGSGAVAASTEASAIYYNPAALTRTGRLGLEGNTFKVLPGLYEDARYSHVAGTFNLTPKCWLGASYYRMGFGERILTDERGPESLAKFEPYDWALTFAAATPLGERTRLGAGFKFVGVNYGPIAGSSEDIAASAFAVDLGFLYDGFLPKAHASKRFLSQPLPWQKWAHHGLPAGFSFGAALANVGTKLKFIEPLQADPLPQLLRLGLAWNIIESDILGLVATGEFNKILVKINDDGSADGALKAIFSTWSDQSLRDEFSEARYSGGVELSLLQLGALRFGRNWDGFSHYGYNTFGYSIGPPGFRFSYAKYTLFESVFSVDNEWHVYTASIALARLPW